MGQASCPFCRRQSLNGTVTTTGKTVRHTRVLTDYRCDTCGRAWSEETKTRRPSRYSPPVGRRA